MLFDPKWEVPVKAKPDFAGFVAFACAQPADSTFNIDKPDECALGRYFKSLGERPPALVSDAAKLFGMTEWDLYRVLWGFGGNPIIKFGGVARRGRRFMRPTIWQYISRALGGR